ncbi:MAG TPA: helix-turn-helix domain-containing protein [Streptosporangiaceae bacterium]|nr:helix-turn-helix domain-containing protein [Streptosporangiaceae bacterium]
MTETGLREMGLRERSKAKRRAAIIRAAYELFAARGYDATTVADIAEAAEVSPRTVALYFPAKQDIAMSRVTDAVAGLTAATQGRQPGDSVGDVMRRWLLTTQTDPEDHQQRMLARRMFAANPGLAALRAARMAEALKGGAAVIAAQTGDEPGAIGPRIAAAATAAIINEILDVEPGPGRDRAVAAAIRFIDAGIAAL